MMKLAESILEMPVIIEFENCYHSIYFTKCCRL